jgi:hypothetical protein
MNHSSIRVELIHNSCEEQRKIAAGKDEFVFRKVKQKITTRCCCGVKSRAIKFVSREIDDVNIED